MKQAGLPDANVYCAVAPRTQYGACEAVRAPELPEGFADDVALVTCRQLLIDAGLDAVNVGTARWNPLGDIIAPGSRVLLKPNWVLHQNHSGAGNDCLITHVSVIEAVLRYALLARPATIVIGDAPVQGCDFERLSALCDLPGMLQRRKTEIDEAGTVVKIEDFRRVVLPGDRVEMRTASLRRSDADYVLFDLQEHSQLEPITAADTEFRVTMYDPAALRRTHAPGTHRYLIAREAIDADVVINLPKLKTHKKAGITGALKNLVGINGHKEYLPHHRKGGAADGGDCYPGSTAAQRWLENTMDTANSSASPVVSGALSRLARGVVHARRTLGLPHDVEGSWHGNDTVWRMALDLQRILRFGRADGTLGDTQQRVVVTLTDAIIAGEGEGPLSPTPAPLGVLTFAANPVAAEYVHALLMHFDPAAIPLIRNAWLIDRYPLVAFAPSDIRVFVNGTETSRRVVVANYARSFRPPQGWAGACELPAAIEVAAS